MVELGRRERRTATELGPSIIEHKKFSVHGDSQVSGMLSVRHTHPFKIKQIAAHEERNTACCVTNGLKGCNREVRSGRWQQAGEQPDMPDV